ncbi:hypothetical protein OSTOST_15532 [Ostertagia ostertagi]
MSLIIEYNDKNSLKESPLHSRPDDGIDAAFNMTLSFRHDSPVASPYAYTSLNIALINGKTLGAAWFVSNCYAASRRGEYVAVLEKYYPVDKYGECEGAQCKIGGFCEKMLDTQ